MQRQFFGKNKVLAQDYLLTLPDRRFISLVGTGAAEPRQLFEPFNLFYLLLLRCPETSGSELLLLRQCIPSNSTSCVSQLHRWEFVQWDKHATQADSTRAPAHDDTKLQEQSISRNRVAQKNKNRVFIQHSPKKRYYHFVMCTCVCLAKLGNIHTTIPTLVQAASTGFPPKSPSSASSRHYQRPAASRQPPTRPSRSLTSEESQGVRPGPPGPPASRSPEIHK